MNRRNFFKRVAGACLSAGITFSFIGGRTGRTSCEKPNYSNTSKMIYVEGIEVNKYDELVYGCLTINDVRRMNYGKAKTTSFR